MPIHMGNGFTLGERGGEQEHTLTISELPQHTHTPSGSTATASVPGPGGNAWCSNDAKPYSNQNGNVGLNPASMSNAGGSQAHDNMPPYLVLSFCIALQGIFPSQT